MRLRSLRRPLLLSTGALGATLLLSGAARGTAAEPARGGAAPQLVDRVVAMVDQDPILLSEVERTIALQLVAPQPGETKAALSRRVLDDLIEQRLRAHEVERFGFEEVPVGEIDAQVAAIRDRFADPAAFRAELAAAGLDEAGLRQLFARQLLVLLYVEERLGPRVFVGLEEIRKHYDEVFAPALAKQGHPVPPIEEVREEIRDLLKEQRLDEEIERWTTQLRREADVVDYLESRHDALPPPIAVVPPR